MTAHEWARLAVPGAPPVSMALPHRFDALGDAVRRGVYEASPPARLVFDLLAAGSVLLDLGAHLGVVALVASRLGATVVAVEAAPGNAACLRASRGANDFALLTIVEAAVSDRPGVVRFREDGAYGQVTGDAGPGVVEVRAAPVTELLREQGLARVDLIKMDVEGHELPAIEGMRELLDRHDAPPVVFESNRHTLHRVGATPADLLSRFEALGYRTYLVGDGELIEAGSSSFQVETVSDYLATKATQPAPAGWVVRPPLTAGELAERIGREARHPLGHSRAAIARALAGAGPELRGRHDVGVAIELLGLDPDPEVAEAAQAALRTVAPGRAGDGVAGPLRRVAAELRAVARQAVALAEVAGRNRA